MAYVQINGKKIAILVFSCIFTIFSMHAAADDSEYTYSEYKPYYPDSSVTYPPGPMESGMRPAYATYDAQDDAKRAEASREEKRTLHIYNNIDLKSDEKIIYKKPRIVVKAIFPTLSSENYPDELQDFNAKVDAIITQETEKFESQVKSLQVAQKKSSKNNNSLYIDYSASYVKSGQDNVLSVRFTVQGIAIGMAHPVHSVRVINYNLDTQEDVELADLFVPNSDYLTKLSTLALEGLQNHIPKNQLLTNGVAPKLENFSNWNVKSNGLVFTFDEATVAPYIYGQQRITIPFSKLQNEISAESVIASCVQNPKTCYRNNQLTGGFIDEARLKSRARTYS